MGERIRLPGSRRVVATLDRTAIEDDPQSVVVACPPHPQHGGHRGDDRLRAVSDELTDRGVDCLRFDYGPWDEGYGECADAAAAVSWGVDRYDRVGLFGFSFGGSVALLAAVDRPAVAAVSALAPTARLNPDADAVEALEHVTSPVQIVYGSRDTTADWEPVVDRARQLAAAGREQSVVEFGADHFFVGQTKRVAAPIATFLLERL
ncbi:MAG: alpha/beta hydrolase [Halobacteriota archaeon]